MNFGLAVLNRLYNLACLCPKQVQNLTCPKQGIVLRAEGLREVERACDRAADKGSVSCPDLLLTE